MFAKLRSYFTADTPAEPAPVSIASPRTVLELKPKPPSPPDLDNLSARAEAAVEDLSDRFETWLYADLQRLFASWAALEADLSDRETARTLYCAAHDLSGLGETYGSPAIARLNRSLCRLLMRGDAKSDAPLIKLHIEACRVAHKQADQADETTNAVCAALEAQVGRVLAVA